MNTANKLTLTRVFLIPLFLVVLYLIGFGIPALNPTTRIPTAVLGTVALVLTYSSYVAEVLRAGLDSVHPSQRYAARSLGLIVEARVGRGSLMLCGADLTGTLDHRPEARQLLTSLLHYMQSDKFHPSAEVTPAMLAALF